MYPDIRSGNPKKSDRPRHTAHASSLVPLDMAMHSEQPQVPYRPKSDTRRWKKRDQPFRFRAARVLSRSAFNRMKPSASF